MPLDSDADGVPDAGDNCPAVVNPGQQDADGDGTGDHCDGGDFDGDGYTDEAEARYIGTSANHPCGWYGWPSNVWDLGPSFNKLDIQDITSFLADPRRLDTSPDPGSNYSPRYDLLPGPGIFQQHINIQDLLALLEGDTGRPPMFGGQERAFGKTCLHEH
jgi:hypothetical protein